MCEMKTEVIEKRKDSWICRVTFNDVEEKESKEREENIISNKESLERVRRHLYDAGGLRSSVGSLVFALNETDIEYEKLMKRQKKYTQDEMDEAMLKLEEVEIRAASYDRMFESREEMRKKVRALEGENEELKAQCKSLKKEKTIADVNIAMLEAQKQLLKYELSDLREGK